MGLVYIHPIVTLLNNNVNDNQDYISFYIQSKYLKIKLLLPHLCYDQHMNIVYIYKSGNYKFSRTMFSYYLGHFAKMEAGR